MRTRQAEPVITYIDLECESERLAATTFTELVATLGPQQDTLEIGVTNSTDIETAAHRLGKALRMKVSDHGDAAHGYRTLHGAATRGGITSQFWVTPNEVARGFVRPDHPDYAVLVDALPGTALRYPEHPDCKLIVQVSELSLDDLLAACARADLSARRIGRA